MLETGNFADLNMDRTHFGAWAIVSSPLILGLDVTSKPTVDRVWDIISNKEAIAVNQQWAGHPGSFAKSWTPAGLDVRYIAPTTCKAGSVTQTQWVYDAAKKVVRFTGGAAGATGNTTAGGNTTSKCWDAQDGGGVLLLPCDGSKTQMFTYQPSSSGDYGRTFMNYNGNCVMVGAMDNRAGAPKPNASDAPPLGLTIGGCNAGDTTIEWTVDAKDNSLTVNKTLCLDVVNDTPDPKLSPLMLWKKPLPGGKTAVLVINNFYKCALEKVEVDLAWLGQDELLRAKPARTHASSGSVSGAAGGDGAVAVRDVWNHKDLPVVTDGKLTLDGALASFDSRFFVLSPTAA